MLIAALCAEGTSEIGNIRQIDRGYERIDERLRGLGARIERVATERVPAPRPAEPPHDPPDPAGHPRRAARRDARAARDLRAPARRSRAPATARSTRPRSSTRRCCAAARSAPPAPRYRLFDEQGDVLALRSDMTIPIARVVATRYADAEPPLRFCYFAHAYRGVERGVGEPREFLQGGIELIGAPAPAGDAEVLALTIAALDEAGLRRHRVGVGDGVALPRAAGCARACPRPSTCRCSSACRAATSSALELRGRAARAGREPRARAAGAPARAARRARGARARRRPGRGGRRGPARAARAAGRARRGRPRDLRPRARARARLLHGRGVRGLRPGGRLRARRRRALRRPARALRPRRCPPAASRSTSSACTWPRPPRRRSR